MPERMVVTAWLRAACWRQCDMVEICQQVSRHKKLKQQNPNTKEMDNFYVQLQPLRECSSWGDRSSPPPGRKGT